MRYGFAHGGYVMVNRALITLSGAAPNCSTAKMNHLLEGDGEGRAVIRGSFFQELIHV